MTLPTDINLPVPENLFTEGAKYNTETYLRELNDRLSDMYQDVAQNVNGYVRNWTPIVFGDTTEGSATYTIQSGWLRRSGIIVELWFDVAWTGHTGTGRVAILMPYEAANSTGLMPYQDSSTSSPFVGVIESSVANTFTGYTYLTCRAEPNTTTCYIVRNGTGVASARLGIASSGGFRGYIRYIGKEFED